MTDAPKQLPKLKILLVEDNAVNQKVTLNQLKALSYRADVVNNGQAALELLQQTVYDLVLMDCQMPILDGYSTTEAIRRLEDDDRRIIIVALTANARREDRVHCIRAGMDDYLSKPVSIEKLAIKLNYWSQVLLSPKEAAMNDSENMTQTTGMDANSPLSPLIDWKHLHQICDNNEEFERELLQTFAEDTEIHLADMAAAIVAVDFDQLEQQAHHVKGASANTGVTTMYRIATELETQARRKQLDGAAQKLLILQSTLQNVQTLLNSHKR